MQIGPYPLSNNLLLAPMAGVTDRPFRQLCRRLGAGLAVSEMVTTSTLQHRNGVNRRLDHDGEPSPRAVQIAGAVPEQMAEAACFNADRGAEIIDINMGCPAKKVCRLHAGSALLRDEALVARILEQVVAAVTLPVTLKIRTGWDRDSRNAVAIARIAEASGIRMLAVHGRTRADAYRGEAEYDTIRAVKQAVSIPVVANGDIDSAEKAQRVLEQSGVDGIMVGRAAQGRPWIFREIAHYLATGEPLPPPTLVEIEQILIEHLHALHNFHGPYSGVRMARKHLAWYTRGLPHGRRFTEAVNRVESAEQQLSMTRLFFDELKGGESAVTSAGT